MIWATYIQVALKECFKEESQAYKDKKPQVC